tara:strand:+ start:474 stop:986 length:513 start_codon:yes stop_codon:yes gene_type:complete
MTWVAVGTIATVGSAVVGGISAVTGGKAAERQAEDQAKLSQQQINEAELALTKLKPAKNAKIKVVQEEYKFASEGLGIEVSESQQHLEEAVGKSDLVTSSGVERKKSTMWDKVKHQEKGAIAQFAKGMGGVEEWFEGESSKIMGEKKRAALAKKAAEDAADAWYLGKNIT